MIVPYWLEDDEAEDQYKAILADHIEHFHAGVPGRSCVFTDHDNETVAGIVHLSGYQPLYKTGDLTGLFFNKRMCTRANILYILEWLFVDLGLTRCNMVTQPHNVQAQRFNTMLGAKLEAVMPMVWGDESAWVYGLLAPDVLKYIERLKNVKQKEDTLVT